MFEQQDDTTTDLTTPPTLANGRFGSVLATIGHRRNPFYLTAFVSEPAKRLSVLGLPAKLINGQKFFFLHCQTKLYPRRT